MAECLGCNKRTGLFSGVFIDRETGLCQECKARVRSEYEERVATIQNVKTGSLPIVTSDLGLQLDSDEFCHFFSKAVYEDKRIGQLIATNKRLMFLSREGGFEVSWKKVVRISSTIETSQASLLTNEGSIYLELTSKTGYGTYQVSEVAIAEAIFNALVKVSKIIRPTGNATRHIPQLIKQSVWLRDEGRCVNCSATSELQFDHIIPHSKGGANTVENIQILCRTCNSNKRARI
jgi:hypothetical protein